MSNVRSLNTLSKVHANARQLLKLRNLEKRQATRRDMVDARKRELDECLERHEREIENLRAQVEQ